MGIVAPPTWGADPVSVTGPGLDAKISPLTTEFNGSIDNDNIKAAAAIANSKLNLTSVVQAVTFTGGLTVSTAAQTMSGMPINEAKGADIASTTTPDITAATGNTVHITGTTTITGFATATAGIRRILIFDGILTFTHNSTSLILPTGANITTAAGDTATMVSEGSGNWRCIDYTRKSGAALAATAVTASSQSQMEAASDNTTTVTPLAVNWNPGVAKAWVQFSGTGSTSILASYNVSSVTYVGTGIYTVNFTTSFSSVNYCWVGSCVISGNHAGILTRSDATTQTESALKLETRTDTSTLTDANIVCVTCFGDQ